MKLPEDKILDKSKTIEEIRESITYHQVGDVMLPDFENDEINEEQTALACMKYAQMRRKYLQEHKRAHFSILKTTLTLQSHLAEVQSEATDRMEALVKQMAKAEGVTEELKASDQMAWVGAMNNIRARAEEIMLPEIVYA